MEHYASLRSSMPPGTNSRQPFVRLLIDSIGLQTIIYVLIVPTNVVRKDAARQIARAQQHARVFR
eukprot:scaffold26723_cov255-Cylindrotheca_fusiformis.AAC.1